MLWKRIKRVGCLAIAAVALAFGFGFTLIMATAEEITEAPQIGAGLGEISTDIDAGEQIPEMKQEKAETTFKDFLAWAQMEADKYGYGEDFAGALSAIEAAASKKQVTLATWGSFALAAAVIVYILVQSFKSKTIRKGVLQLIERLDGKLDDEIKGTNALIDETNLNGKTERDTKAKLDETERELAAMKRGMVSFATAFLRFTDGVKLGENKKTEVQNSCLAALKEFNGVKNDENNEI